MEKLDGEALYPKITGIFCFRYSRQADEPITGGGGGLRELGL